MKLLGRKSFNEFFGLDDVDEEIYLSEENDQADQYERPTVVKKSRPSFANVFSRKNQVATDETAEQPKSAETETNFDQLAEEKPAVNRKIVELNAFQTTSQSAKQSKNVKMSETAASAGKIVVIEPKTYTDCKKIAQALFRREIVIINFSSIVEPEARRIVDFATGTVYALDGDIQRIGDETFLCTPEAVEIDSTIAKSLVKSQLFDY